MEITLSEYAKKKTFLPEFSIQLCISSSVAIQMIKMHGNTDKEERREGRMMRGEEKKEPKIEVQNNHMIRELPGFAMSLQDYCTIYFPFFFLFFLVQ